MKFEPSYLHCEDRGLYSKVQTIGYPLIVICLFVYMLIAKITRDLVLKHISYVGTCSMAFVVLLNHSLRILSTLRFMYTCALICFACILIIYKVTK